MQEEGDPSQKATAVGPANQGVLAPAGQAAGAFAPAEAVNDAQAIAAWLGAYEGHSAHTLRALKKECHRFMAWLWSTRGADPSHLPKVGVADVSAYLRFLEAPSREPL